MWFVFNRVVSPTSLLHWLQEFLKFCFQVKKKFEWAGRHLNVIGTHISVGCRCLREEGKRSAPAVWLAEIWPAVLKAPPPAGVWLAPPAGPETPCHGTRTTWREEEIRGQSVVEDRRQTDRQGEEEGQKAKREPEPLSWRCLQPDASSVWAPQLQE